MTVAQEIEHTLAQGFAGKITLHCSGDGTVGKVAFEEFWRPGEERRRYERRTDGPRNGEDRRKG